MLATALVKWVLLVVIAGALLAVLALMYFSVGRRGRETPRRSRRP